MTVPKKPKLKEGSLNLLLLFFSLSLAVVAVEIVLRITQPPPPERLDPQIKYERVRRNLEEGREVAYYHLVPNHKAHHFDTVVESNSLGIRNREIGEKKEEVFRILALGDSHTFGFAVEESQTWPRLLESKLHNQYKKQNYEVINAGIEGLAIEQEIQFLKDRLLNLQPDLVFLAYYWNDMPIPGQPFDVWPAGKEMLADSMQPQPSPTKQMSPPLEPDLVGSLRELLKKSFLVYWIFQRLPALQMNFYPSNVTLWKKATLEGKTSQRMDAAWKFVYQKLKELKELGRTHGFEVVVLAIPLFEQIVASGYSGEQYQGRLKEICSDLNLRLIDPLEEIRTVNPTYPEFFIPFDGHPNGKVYEVMAIVTARFLVEQTLD